VQIARRGHDRCDREWLLRAALSEKERREHG
jgi:hypothetical protein